MSTATQVTTFSDLYTDLQNRVRETTGVTATENQAKRYINIALQDMHIGRAENLPWAERSAILITRAQYTTGTVTASQGNDTITGASTAWTTTDAFGIANARQGGKITISGTLDIYEVMTVVGATSIQFTSDFVGDDVSATTYTYFEDEYALAADFLRPIDQGFFADTMPIPLISRTEFRRRYPTNSVPGRPRVATITDHPFTTSTAPIRKIRFSPPPSEAFSIPYSYVTAYLGVTSGGAEQSGLINDTDEPIVPLRYRHAIVFHALYHWYRDKKNDSRSQEAKLEYEQIMDRIASDTEIGSRHTAIRPRRGTYVGSAKRPWRRGNSAQFDINGRFDRMES